MTQRDNPPGGVGDLIADSARMTASRPGRAAGRRSPWFWALRSGRRPPTPGMAPSGTRHTSGLTLNTAIARQGTHRHCLLERAGLVTGTTVVPLLGQAMELGLCRSSRG